MILDELAAHARERVAADKAKISLEDMKAQAEALPKGDFRFEKALSGKECAFICEVKKASPSKGIIDPVFDFEKHRAKLRGRGRGLCFVPDRTQVVSRIGRNLQKGQGNRHQTDDTQGFYGG